MSFLSNPKAARPFSTFSDFRHLLPSDEASLHAYCRKPPKYCRCLASSSEGFRGNAAEVQGAAGGQSGSALEDTAGEEDILIFGGGDGSDGNNCERERVFLPKPFIKQVMTSSRTEILSQ
eukprot:CAMPEP_0169148362 /NCGR_PEP_ID=MMETSP1015-20121227/48814_1 /TAXON_ID=342587 /ORGANISM="Karlodinium micrum, Strain CCMP2283" /LENGTH=119 /DNA_ID=CAMNT_0009216833 /DNA_START=436 /DNA_END=793 /DNA_ORIENTATION=-